MVQKIDKIISRISGGTAAATYVAFVGIMLIIGVDVFLRMAFKRPILGSYEIVERMLLILVFAAFAYTQSNRGHIHVTLFLSRFPNFISMPLFGILGLLSTATSVFCGYATWAQADYSLKASTVTAVLHIPLYPFFYIAAICMYVFSLTLLWDTIKSFIGIANEDVRNDIKSSWE